MCRCRNRHITRLLHHYYDYGYYNADTVSYWFSDAVTQTGDFDFVFENNVYLDYSEYVAEQVEAEEEEPLENEDEQEIYYQTEVVQESPEDYCNFELEYFDVPTQKCTAFKLYFGEIKDVLKLTALHDSSPDPKAAELDFSYDVVSVKNNLV